MIGVYKAVNVIFILQISMNVLNSWIGVNTVALILMAVMNVIVKMVMNYTTTANLAMVCFSLDLI